VLKRALFIEYKIFYRFSLLNNTAYFHPDSGSQILGISGAFFPPKMLFFSVVGEKVFYTR